MTHSGFLKYFKQLNSLKSIKVYYIEQINDIEATIDTSQLLSLSIDIDERNLE